MNRDEIENEECERCDGTGVIEDPFSRGKFMREQRVGKLLALREVARRMEISAAYLSDLEHGRRRWSEGLIEDYEEALRQAEESVS